MNRVLSLLFISIGMLPALCLAAPKDGYGYPILDSYDATIMGTPDPLKATLPENIPTWDLVLNLKPEADKPKVFFYDEGLHYTLAYQKKKAPLVFLIGGTGSNHKTPKLVAMMKSLHEAGFHVVTLASPTHPNFIINASRSHIPGDLIEDSEDLYRVMHAVWQQVKDHIEVSRFYLSGYSLGGTQAAFVARLDERLKYFNFTKVLMVNPAVSLYDSMLRIENLLNSIPGGPKKISRFLNRTLSKFVNFYREGDFVAINSEFLYEAYRAHLINENDAQGLIGLAFRINSAGMIFTSDIMTNGGYIVPKNRILSTSDSLDDYFRVGVHLSFLQYFEEYFYPHFKQRQLISSKEKLIQDQNLKSIESYLMNNRKFGVMTNENDFILSSDDLNYLRQLFGQRTKIYPRGGHLGNLEYRDNMADFVNFFRTTK